MFITGLLQLIKVGSTTLIRKTKQQYSQWKLLHRKKAKFTKSFGKNMFNLFMDHKGSILTTAVPKWPDSKFRYLMLFKLLVRYSQLFVFLLGSEERFGICT